MHTAGEPEIVLTPSASGKGQKIARCPTCRVAVWSNYPQAGHSVRFVRVGTMDSPDLCPPDIHIFTSSKQPWVTLAPTPRRFLNRRSRRSVAGREPRAPPSYAGKSEAIVVKINQSAYWLKIKNPAAPTVRGLEEEDWNG